MHEFICVREPENVIIPRVGGPCESGPEPTFVSSGLTFFYANIQNFLAKRAELEARLCLFPSLPSLVCLTETHLDVSCAHPAVSGYSLIARRDRDAHGGGVAIFAADAVADVAALCHRSIDTELVWITVHAVCGPVLSGCFYRRPHYSGICSIERLGAEWSRLEADHVQSVIVGDMNVHHMSWLRYSSHTSSAGVFLREWARDRGLTQRVRSPTRGPHLLDLVLTDCPDITVEVLSELSDHRPLSLRLPCPPLSFDRVERVCWHYGSAD